MRDASVINRRDESGNVADHSATKTNDKRLPIQSGGDHLIANRAGLLESLRFLTRGNCDQWRPKIG
jgi:hypothetical protein